MRYVLKLRPHCSFASHTATLRTCSPGKELVHGRFKSVSGRHPPGETKERGLCPEDILRGKPRSAEQGNQGISPVGPLTGSGRLESGNGEDGPRRSAYSFRRTRSCVLVSFRHKFLRKIRVNSTFRPKEGDITSEDGRGTSGKEAK